MIAKIKRSIGRYLFFSIKWLIKHLNYKVYKGLLSFFMFLGHVFMSKKRKLAKENLIKVYGKQKTETEIDEIVKKCFNTFSYGMIDLIYLLDRPSLIKEWVSIEGEEHLQKALAQGKGAIILSAHMGSFILMYLRIIQQGYKTNVIMRRTRDEDFEKHISALRKAQSMNTIYALPQRQCIQQSIKVLRNGELLFMLLDQHYGAEGRVEVDFFGQKAATATGPLVFSKRVGSPIVPMFIIKDESKVNGHKILILPEVELNQFDEDPKAIIENVQVLSNIIEDMVKKYPHEWGGWMHKRWKINSV